MLNSKIKQYRKDLDKIDQEIVNLLKKRTDIVAKVGIEKEQLLGKAQSKNRSFMYPSREIEMVQNLCNYNQNLGSMFPNASISAIWRVIIASALQLEEGFKIGIYKSKRLHSNQDMYQQYVNISKDFFSNIVDIICFDDVALLYKKLLAMEISVVIISPDDIEALREFDPKIGLQMFAYLPIYIYPNTDKKTKLIALSKIENPGFDNIFIKCAYSHIEKEEIDNLLNQERDFCQIVQIDYDLKYLYLLVTNIDLFKSKMEKYCKLNSIEILGSSPSSSKIC